MDEPLVGYAKSAEKPKPLGPLEVHRVEIEPSENGGFSVRCFKREKKTAGSRSTYMGYIDPEMYTFESFDSMSAFLKKTLA